jgi:hypothetical protein
MQNGDHGFYSSRDIFKVNPIDPKTMTPAMQVFMSMKNKLFLQYSIENSLQKLYGSNIKGFDNKFRCSIHFIDTETPSLINLPNFRYFNLDQMNMYAFRYFLQKFKKRLRVYAETPRYCSNFLDSQSRVTPPIARRKVRYSFRMI